MNKGIALAATVLLSAATALAAPVYRWVDSGGTVHYSDDAPASAEAVILEWSDGEYLEWADPVGAGSLARAQLARSAQAVRATAVYPVLKVASPAPHETVWADNGRIEIVALTSPPLHRNQAFVYKLDGVVRAGPTHRYSVTLGKVFRGSHTVSVAVVDDAGQVVQSSAPVTVYVKHHTILN